MRKTAILSLVTAYALVISPPVWAMGCGALLRSWAAAVFTPAAAQDPATKMIGEGLAGLRQAGILPQEGHGPPEQWSIDGPERPRRSYMHAFSDLMQDLGAARTEFYFENLLRAKRAAGGSAHVCDLMGSGYFIEDRSAADSVTGLRWGAFRRDSAEDFKIKKPVEVLGDILNPATWDALDASMRERGIPALDLAVMRPEGGWMQSPWYKSPAGNVHALKIILGQVLRRLSPDGHFYFEIKTPQVRGKFSERPALQALIREIEARTPYRLVLHSSVSAIGTTYRLSGALVPKNFAP
jgi:hypothetical protein